MVDIRPTRPTRPSRPSRIEPLTASSGTAREGRNLHPCSACASRKAICSIISEAPRLCTRCLEAGRTECPVHVPWQQVREMAGLYDTIPRISETTPSVPPCGMLNNIKQESQSSFGFGNESPSMSSPGSIEPWSPQYMFGDVQSRPLDIGFPDLEKQSVYYDYDPTKPTRSFVQQRVLSQKVFQQRPAYTDDTSNFAYTPYDQVAYVSQSKPDLCNDLQSTALHTPLATWAADSPDDRFIPPMRTPVAETRGSAKYQAYVSYGMGNNAVSAYHYSPLQQESFKVCTPAPARCSSDPHHFGYTSGRAY